MSELKKKLHIKPLTFFRQKSKNTLKSRIPKSSDKHTLLRTFIYVCKYFVNVIYLVYKKGPLFTELELN